MTEFPNIVNDVFWEPNGSLEPDAPPVLLPKMPDVPVEEPVALFAEPKTPVELVAVLAPKGVANVVAAA